jgi:hypothetical protein
MRHELQRHGVGELMLQDQVISVNFGQGIDTKTDPKLVVAGKLTRLENGVFTNAKRVSKRNGYDAISASIYGGGTLSSPKLLKAYRDELVCADQGHFYSYSVTLQKWVDKGNYVSVAVTNSQISGTTTFANNLYSTQMSQSSAVSGNYVISTWAANLGSPSYSIYATIRDTATGLNIYPETALVSASAALPAPKVVTLGSGVFGVFYISSSLTSLLCITLTVTSSGVTVSSPLTIATDFGYRYFFDVVATASGCALIYNAVVSSVQNAAVKILTIDSNGLVTHTATNTTAGRSASIPYPVTVSYDSANAQIWAIYTVGATTSSMSFTYYCYNSTLSSVVASGTFGLSTDTITKIGACTDSAGSQILIYNYANPTLSTLSNMAAYRLTNAGTAFVYNFSSNAIDLFSKPFVISNKVYVTGIYYNTLPTQNTCFVFDVASGTVASKFLLHSAWKESAEGVVTYPVNQITATKVSLLCPYIMASEQVGGISQLTPLIGSTLITLDFDHQDSYQATQADNALILNGGSPKLYDGNSLSNFGFDVYPVVTATAAGSGTSTMAVGTYVYYAVYQWVDANGDVHYSTPSDAVSITLAGANNGVNLTVSNYPFRDKSNVQVLVFRTTANGVAAYLMKAFQNAASSYSQSFQDLSSDSDLSLSSAQALYTNGGVIENTACPPSLIHLIHNNRFWVLDSETSNSWWYSKTLGPGIGVSMSDLLTYQADSIGGESTGGASLDDKLVIFKRTMPLFVSGDGANDSGANATLTTCQRIPSDTGCKYSKSVVVGPNGVMFKGDKGIYLLDRSLGMSYVGAEAESYNSYNVTSAVLLQSVNQIRFLTSDGTTLVFDYIFNQWSTFTNHQGYAATIWQGVYCYVRTDGAIYKENASSYRDNATAFALKAQTAWLKLSAVQGFQRVRRLGLLGDYTGASGHGVQISASYDYGTTFSTAIQYLPSASSGVLQYRERLPQQKCEAIQLLIEEVTTGASGEFIDFTDLTFEAGLKRGMNKMPAGQSV